MRAADQREIIEQLLGITLLSEKAEILKNSVKDTKDLIISENATIEATKKANENIQKSIDSLIIRSSAWDSKQESDISIMVNNIHTLSEVNIEDELALHVQLKQWTENNTKIINLNKQRATLESAVGQAEKSVAKYTRELESLANKTCHACEQELHDHKHEEMSSIAQQHLAESKKYFDKVSNDYNKVVALGITRLQEQGTEASNFLGIGGTIIESDLSIYWTTETNTPTDADVIAGSIASKRNY
jgi:hypothetical protein